MKNEVPMVRLGELIEECDERNSNNMLSLGDVRGVANTKSFIPTKANMDGRSFKEFSLIRPDWFAFNRRTTRNGERLALGFNDTSDTFICTEDYVVFKVKEKQKGKLLPGFLYMFFLRPEFDRYVRWDSWGSATEFFNWENMCRVKITLPDIEVQRDLVAIYSGQQKIVSENEELVAHLEAVCHDFVIDCKSKYPKVKLGDWITESDERNGDNALKLENVRGISVEKKFIPTKANMSGVSLTSYKIVKPHWFCYVPVTSRNGGRISLAIFEESTPAIVSSTYYIFRSKDENILLPEYLFLLFNRAEFDRYARYNSWGSAREVFDFSEMCRVEIPLPPIEIQRSIAAVTHCLDEAKRIVSEARDLMKNICPALVQKAAHSA